MRAPDTSLPPWKPRNAREQRWLREWTIEQLELRTAAADAKDADLRELREPNAGAPLPPEVHYRQRYADAVSQARSGHLEPLRRMFPGHAAFINPPPRPRGQRKSYPRKINPFSQLALELALADVKEIRAIWQEHYDGRWKRSPTDSCSTPAIAAARWGLDVDVLRETLKRRKSRKSRKSRKRRREALKRR